MRIALGLVVIVAFSPLLPWSPLSPSRATAQPSQPAAGKPAKLAGGSAAPAGAVASASASFNPIAVPPPPVISDPMLAPVPRPTRIVSSWAEVMTYLHARSTDLKIAIDNVLEAEALTRQALAQYLPSINGNFTYTHNLITRSVAQPTLVPGVVQTSSIPTPDVGSGGIQLQQDVINFPEFDQISIDELGEDAARLSVEDEKRTLALSVANQIVSVVTAEREAEINRVGLRVALEQLEITARKKALGAANGLDVVRAQQNAANARATLVTGDESLREAREALGLALGVPEETGVSPDINVDAMATNAMASCRTVRTVEERADVDSLRLKLDVAKRNLRNVYYQFLPTVNLASTLSATTAAPTGYPNPTWSVAGIVTVPIWDGGNRYGLLKNARAAEDMALQQLEAARRQAVIQVEQARRQLVVAEQSDQVAREQRDLAAQNDQMTQTAYSVGQGTSLELVTASEAHRQAELNLALQDFAVVKARILAILALATCPW
ncbi:MAG TPA: TolC family protein [Polyangiaceae bacterium]|jgi:multidrug efflux system outer membrane protein|nr:TolC family protein [Polyangiaceae bacterium]